MPILFSCQSWLMAMPRLGNLFYCCWSGWVAPPIWRRYVLCVDVLGVGRRVRRREFLAWP
jgi:hypothetical protein